MFSASMVGLLVGLSAAAWVYSKTMQRTGNNTKNALIMAGIVGFMAFLIIWIVIVMIDSALE
jgi:hypothetical protein